MPPLPLRVTLRIALENVRGQLKAKEEALRIDPKSLQSVGDAIPAMMFPQTHCWTSEDGAWLHRPLRSISNRRRVSRCANSSRSRRLSTKSAACRAYRSSSRISRSAGRRGALKCTERMPTSFPPRVISGVLCTARKPALAAAAR